MFRYKIVLDKTQISKTEQEMWSVIERKGFWHTTGKRAWNMVKKLQKQGKLDGYYVSLSCFNGNGVEFKSQWNHPKFLMCYEIVVRHPEY